jgi:hypothetical protein
MYSEKQHEQTIENTDVQRVQQYDIGASAVGRNVRTALIGAQPLRPLAS